MLKVAGIGPGRMGQNYLNVLRSIPDVEVVAVCGNRVESTEAAAKALQCAAYPNGEFSKMLDSHPDVSCVLISTPEWHHLAPLKESLSRNLDILIEKPILGTFDEFEWVSGDLGRYSKSILPCLTCRFDPRYFLSRESINSKQNEIRRIYSRRNTDFKTASRVYGKIPMPYWILCHDADLLRWYTGSEVKSVRAKSRTSEGYLERDYIIAELSFENGTLGTIENSWMQQPLSGPWNHSALEIDLDSARVEVDLSSPSTAVFDSSQTEQIDVFDLYKVGDNFYGNSAMMIKHFVEVVRGNESPIVSVGDAVQAMYISEAIHRSIRESREVFLGELH